VFGCRELFDTDGSDYICGDSSGPFCEDERACQSEATHFGGKCGKRWAGLPVFDVCDLSDGGQDGSRGDQGLGSGWDPVCVVLILMNGRDVFNELNKDQVLLGTVMGALLGWTFSKFMKYAHRLGWIDRESYVAQYLALAVFITGLVSTVGSDDLLAAFAAGE
jgi:hypothetical protein